MLAHKHNFTKFVSPSVAASPDMTRAERLFKQAC
jgi:hypothetical protein